MRDLGLRSGNSLVPSPTEHADSLNAVRDLLGLRWTSVRRGLYLGSAIGTAFVLSIYIDHHIIS